ncbi:MAG: hypothetical protein WA051_01005 [Minisyncoccia bacterium]
MDVTLLVSKIFGVYLLVAGVFLIFKGKTIPYLLKDFFDHPAVCYLTGVILLFLSSMYLIQYNIWDGTWKTIVTAFVWITLLKGLVYIFAPKILSEMTIQNNKRFFNIYGVLAILVGVYLFWLL